MDWTLIGRIIGCAFIALTGVSVAAGVVALTVITLASLSTSWR